MGDGPRLRLVLTGDDGGADELVVTLPVELGRDPASVDVVVADRMVSRRHARLEAEGHRLVLTDLGSANGTWVDAEAIERRQLRADDVVVLGSTTLAWAFDDLPAVRARQVVEAAEAGSELDGFLSFEYGFLPREPPLTALPASHRAWDDLAERLPELFTGLGMREALDALPLLDAGPEALPDAYLYRASTLLGNVAHAYWYAEIAPPDALPEAVEKPWREVSRRLGKPVPHVSYVDLFLYNWRLRDPSGPRRLANLELLVPTWANEAERIFYLVTAEFAMELAPVLGAMVRAQEAVVAADGDALVVELRAILDRFRHLTRTIYPQIDPNPSSLTHCNQVLWAKTVGIAGVPVIEGAPSPAGTAQPQFHAMDAFFGRGRYETTVGQQSLQLRATFPPAWASVIEALTEVSVDEFVRESGEGELRGLWAAVLDAYAGDHGWMGLHRIKAYGFLEVAFTVGRAVTTGARFTGLFRDKTWEKIDAELAEVRDERWPVGNQQVIYGRPAPGSTVTNGTWVVELDVAGSGVHFEAGDRLGVLPENDADLVRRTLTALRATGDEIVVLTPDWREAVAARAGYAAGTEVLPLKTVLTFGRIRPMTRPAAKRLVALSANGSLRRIVEARMEDQWELWDVLTLLHAGGFDVTRLWSAGPDDPESICRVVAPEVFRLYSLASAPPDTGPGGPGATRLRLVVGGLAYTTPRTTYSYPRDRAGTASSFWRRMTEARHRHRELSLAIVPTPRFRLPDDPTRPVLMVAAGSGIAPFLGFCEARARDPRSGPTLLVLGLRSPDDLVGREDLDRWAAAGALTVHAAFSRRDETLAFDPATGAHGVVPGKARRLDALLGEPEYAALLAELVRPEAAGGAGGHVYVCGRADIAAAVMAAVRTAVAEHAPDLDPDSVLRRMVADARYAQDVFTTYRGHARSEAPIEISTLVEHTTDEAGAWMVVGGTAYDVTEFAHQHVGGVAIVRAHVGTDATAAYRGVLHHERPEVDAMLGMYELGPMRRLDLGGAWGVVLGESGLRHLPLDKLFTAWVRAIYLVVEMDNALINDYGFADTAPTRDSVPGVVTPYTAQFVVEAHRRFVVSYLDGLLDDELGGLAEITTAFCARDRDLAWFAGEVRRLREQPDHRVARLATVAARDAIRDRAAVAACRAFVTEDRRLLTEIKSALRQGILAFERHEAAVVEQAGDVLITALDAVVRAVAAYDVRLAGDAREAGLGVVADPDAALVEVAAVPADRGIPGHGASLGE